jgi:signal transduction protein with GAF and PtsI domain
MTGEAIGVELGCLMTFRDDYSIDLAYTLGADDPASARSELWNHLLKQGLVGFVRHSQRTVVVRNISTDPRWPQLPEAPFIPRGGSAIGLPLLRAGQVFGVLMFIHPQFEYFDRRTPISWKKSRSWRIGAEQRHRISCGAPATRTTAHV